MPQCIGFPEGKRLAGTRVRCEVIGFWVWRRETPVGNEKGFLMKAFARRVKDFLVNDDGPTATEYAVMLALIIVVAIAAITALGSNVNSTIADVNSTAFGS